MLRLDLQPLKKSLLYGLVAAILVLHPALVQSSPGSGSLLQQVEPRLVPFVSPSGTGLKIDSASTPRLPLSAPFLVQRIEISGNTVFPTHQLQALVVQAVGQLMTLPQLGELTSRITNYYRSQGYSLARAIIPAQTIYNGTVRIEVIEAYYGKINLQNKSVVADSFLLGALAPLQIGQVINQTILDKTLLQIGDLPGVVVGATLEPGEQVGTSDLTLRLTSGPIINGIIFSDNYGNSNTGRLRTGVNLNLVNPLQHSEVITLSGLSSGSGVNYGRVVYENWMNSKGFRLGSSLSSLKYEMEMINGTASVQSFWAKQTLKRSRTSNVYAQLQFDKLTLIDFVSTAKTDRHMENFTVSLNGDLRDAFLAGAVSTWNASWTGGKLGFNDATAALANADTTNTQGSFLKANLSVSRLQRLSASSSVYLAFSGQWTNGNLDSSQKLLAGGPNSVRAYDVGALLGDTGYFAVAELRRDTGEVWGGQFQALAFIDSAHLTLNKKLWSESTAANYAILSGAGVGLNWIGLQWNVRSNLATALGPKPTLLSKNNAWRAWVEVTKRF